MFYIGTYIKIKVPSPYTLKETSTKSSYMYNPNTQSKYKEPFLYDPYTGEELKKEQLNEEVEYEIYSWIDICEYYEKHYNQFLISDIFEIINADEEFSTNIDNDEIILFPNFDYVKKGELINYYLYEADDITFELNTNIMSLKTPSILEFKEFYKNELEILKDFFSFELNFGIINKTSI